MKNKLSLQPQRGMIMLLALMILAGILAISVSLASRTLGSSHHVRRDYHVERVFAVADGGADVAESWLHQTLAVNPKPSQAQLDVIAAPTVPDYAFEEYRILKRPFLNDVLVNRGAQHNLYADIQPYRITSHAANHASNVDQIVRVDVNQESIGLYQYGIYYDEDLEIFPNFPLDYIGRVHTNGNLYIGSHNTLDLSATTTAAGHIYNTPKDPTQIYRGKARFQDERGQWHDLSYDSRDPDWVTKSLEDWDGLVMDSAHGITELPFPLPTTTVPHDIIERPVFGEAPEIVAKKYYYKAGLRIMDGVATDSLGNTVTLPAGVLTTSYVYDYREQRTMQMRNLDMAALIAANKVPSNRLIFVSDTYAGAALRIKNASRLPEHGIVIATDNPCYVVGHYNNVDKQPSSILCDAFNVFSSGWSDGNASKPLNKRIASATTVNTCVVTGNQATTPGHYGGGCENLIRLHEKWVGHQLTYRGSLVCLWTSEQAVGLFENASYVEAQRDWGFDRDLLDPEYWPADELSATSIKRGSWTSSQ